MLGARLQSPPLSPRKMAQEGRKGGVDMAHRPRARVYMLMIFPWNGVVSEELSYLLHVCSVAYDTVTNTSCWKLPSKRCAASIS